MKKIIILAILLSALSSEAQQIRIHNNGFFNIRNNKFGWFGTSGTDTVGYVDSLKVKWFKPVMPGFYTTSTVPTASSFTGSIIYNTDSSLHQYSNGSAWVNLPGIGGGGGSGSGDFSSNTSTSVDNEIVLFSGTGGKTGKRATQTGLLLGTSGVLSAVTTSSGISGAISDETGSGALVFGTTPTFTTSIINPLTIGGTGTTSTLTFRTTSGVGTTNADMIFQGGNNGTTEFARFLNSGNLGLGTPTPAEKLHILRDADALAFARFTNLNVGVSAGAGFSFETNGGLAYIYRTSNAYVSGLGDDLVFQEAGGGDMVWFTANEKMRLLNNGNFGIGINNPGRVLDIFHGSQAQIRLSAIAGSSYSEIFGTGGNFYLSGSSTTNTLVAIGGSTSAFPGVRRNATILEAVLADGSALTDMNIAGRAYNATTWNGSNRAVSEDAIRDKVETLASQSALNDTAAAIRSAMGTSGEYSPTLTATTNLDAVTLVSAHYYRTGNYCIVYINFTADPTATGFADFGVSLPFASEISASSEVIGHGALTAGGGSVEVATISGDVTNNRAVVALGATATSTQAYFASFSYKITPP